MSTTSDEVVVSTSTDEEIPVWPEPIYTEEDYIGWKTYTNEKLGYRIKYPADWNINACDEGCASKEVIINPPDAEMFTSYISIILGGGNIDNEINGYLNPSYWEGKIYQKNSIIFSGEKAFLLNKGPHKNNSIVIFKHNKTVFRISAQKDNNIKALQSLSSFEFID